MQLSSNATSQTKLLEEIVTLILHRAKQQEELARTVHLGSHAAALRLNAAQVLENVAMELKNMELAGGK